MTKPTQSQKSTATKKPKVITLFKGVIEATFNIKDKEALIKDGWSTEPQKD